MPWTVRRCLAVLLAFAATLHAAPAGSGRGAADVRGPAVCPAPAHRDGDDDGLDDGCEWELARRFAPELVVAPGGCNWTAGVDPGRPGGAYLYAVQPGPTAESLVLAYLPAYFRDCGWRGPKCLLIPGQCSGHDGDSELIALRLVPTADASDWTTAAVFLSAHCFGRSGDGCRWYEGADLDRLTWRDGRSRVAPVVWVAEGSQANYPSRTACDRGHHFVDTCDRNTVRLPYPLASERQNVGSRHRPFLGRIADDCVRLADVGIDAPEATAGSAAVECLWRNTGAFRGWQAGSVGSSPTPYGRYLGEVLGL